MSTCDKCGSNRIAEIFAHSRDCSSFVCPADELYAENTYFPEVPGICGGDDLDINLCLECGKVQGTFPIKIEPKEGYLSVGKLKAKLEEAGYFRENEFTERELEVMDDIYCRMNASSRQYIADYEVADTFDEEQLKLVNTLLGEEYE